MISARFRRQSKGAAMFDSRHSRIRDSSGGLYSQHRLALERTDGARFTRLFVEQPLRAESGSVRFRRPVGRTRAGGGAFGNVNAGETPAYPGAFAIGERPRRAHASAKRLTGRGRFP